MATVILLMSTKLDKTTQKSEIILRFFHGRYDHRAKTGVFVDPKYWDHEDGMVRIPKIRAMSPANRTMFENLEKQGMYLEEMKSYVVSSFMEMQGTGDTLPSNWVVTTVQNFNASRKNVDKVEDQEKFLEVFLDFIDRIHDMADSQRRQYRVIHRALHRFTLYTGVSIEFADFTAETLRRFDDYLRDEHEFISVDRDGKPVIVDRKFEEVYAQVPESRLPQERGKNARIKMMSRLRTFMNWAVKNKYMKEYPFANYEMGTPIFCTPYYLTKEERNLLYHTQFPNRPGLEIQRDIFVLQTFIGCRIGDYVQMTKENIINGAIEYIPRKTKEGRPVTVRVPLTPTALEILAKYPKVPGNKLMPFISPQRYNDCIKDMIRLAGIDRLVTTINQKTREEEKHPIWEVASSHMARRILVGNLYREVADPNLISKISGHVEGSRAFNRYRDIDEEMAKELILKLE